GERGVCEDPGRPRRTRLAAAGQPAAQAAMQFGGIGALAELAHGRFHFCERGQGCCHAGSVAPATGALAARLDRPITAAYGAGMDHADLIAQLRATADRVDALAARAQLLAEGNRSLRQQPEQLAGERSQLLAKNEE